MYFIIDTFMTKDLHLSKTELLVFALVYHFSQNNNGCYFGSMKNAADALGCTDKSVKNAINALTERGLIKCIGRRPAKENAGYVNEYVAVLPERVKEKISNGGKNFPSTGQKIYTEGGKKFPTRIDIDKKEEKKGVSLSELMQQYGQR